MNTEEHAAHHPHKTGHQWLDLTLGLSAFFISLVSLGLAIVHGRTMEHMADANARLVAANSWPFLSYSAGTNSVDGIPTLHLRVVNAGVGPAKIESAELIWKGTAYRSDEDFLKACCGAAGSELKFDSDLLQAEVLRAGSEITFLGFKQPTNPSVFALLQQAMISRDLQLRICYCSIFDECWSSDLTLFSLKPASVESCDKPRVPFDQGMLPG